MKGGRETPARGRWKGKEGEREAGRVGGWEGGREGGYESLHVI